MAKNQNQVFQFLDKISSSMNNTVRVDLAKIQRAKLMYEEDSVLYPWDIPFYVHNLKSHEHQFSSSEITPYLSLDNCIEGMKLLCEKLFGIDMREVKMDEGEGWCEEEKVRKLSLFHEYEGPLGTIYLDLYPRENKYAHAAHFAIRCGCAVNGDEHFERGELLSFQLPIVALVCSLSLSTDENILLSQSEMETLFHEFGHAMHSLLSRTTFQHLSGTRAPIDFVETPSQLMELFVRDKRVLDSFASHYQTGECIPEDMHVKLEASRRSYQSIDIFNQILYARFDQYLFGNPTGLSSSDLFAKLHRQMQIPFAENTFWHSRFGHIVT